MVSVSVVKEWIEVTNGCLAMREETTENLDSVVHNLLYSKNVFPIFCQVQEAVSAPPIS